MMRVLGWFLAGCMAQAACAAPAEKEAQADLIVARLVPLIQTNQHAQALPLMAELEAVGTPLPESFYFYYADALDKTGDVDAALRRAEDYQSRYGRKGFYFERVSATISRLNEVVKQRELEAQQREQRRLAEEEQKRIRAEKYRLALADYEQAVAEYRQRSVQIESRITSCKGEVAQTRDSCMEAARKRHEGIFSTNWTKLTEATDFCARRFDPENCDRLRAENKMPVRPVE